MHVIARFNKDLVKKEFYDKHYNKTTNYILSEELINYVKERINVDIKDENDINSMILAAGLLKNLKSNNKKFFNPDNNEDSLADLGETVQYAIEKMEEEKVYEKDIKFYNLDDVEDEDELLLEIKITLRTKEEIINKYKID